MKAGPRTKIVDLDPPEPSLDDLRILTREIKLCNQLGDNQVIREARSALLRVHRAAAARLLKNHKIVFE